MSSEVNEFLKRAIELAEESGKSGGFPAGALIVKDGVIISEALSVGFLNNDPTGHAEIVAIREACQKMGTTDLSGAILYESCQSCMMCFSACSWAHIGKIVYAAKKTVEMVEKIYYESSLVPEEVNIKNTQQIVLIHVPEMEAKSLKVIKDWEDRDGFFQKDLQIS